MIKPALRRGWRDRQTLQYGVTPAHAVLLGPVDDTTAALVDRMDGTRSIEQLRAEAGSLGLDPAATDQIVSRLTDAGVLDDNSADRRAAAEVSDALRPDLAALSVMHREPGGGLRRLVARRDTSVQVRGAGRVGALVAATLSAAGVGRVDVVDGGHVQPWDTMPGGLSADRVGERRDSAARRAVHHVRPWRSRARPGVSLVVMTPRDGLDAYAPDPAAAEPFVEAGTPHLYGGVVEGTGVIGPLVRPGVSPCAECLLRGRAEREPSWPLVVGQWRTTGRRRSGVGACDTALATTVAGATASYALNFLDGDGDGACADGYRLCLTLPHLLPRTERFAAHPECPCGAASAAATSAVEGAPSELTASVAAVPR